MVVWSSSLEVGNSKRATARYVYYYIYIYAFFILLFWSYLQEAAGVAFHFLSIALSTSFCDVQNNNTYKIHKRIMTI